MGISQGSAVRLDVAQNHVLLSLFKCHKRQLGVEGHTMAASPHLSFSSRTLVAVIGWLLA